MPLPPRAEPPDQSIVTVADTQQIEQHVTRPSTLYLGDLTVTFASSGDVPSTMPTKAQVSAEDEQAFHRLAAQWRSETRHMSLAADKAANFSLHQIIGMGDRALPLILQELQTKTTDWFWALRAIAVHRAPTIPPEDQGVVRRIADIWIQWGKNNGYLRS